MECLNLLCDTQNCGNYPIWFYFQEATRIKTCRDHLGSKRVTLYEIEAYDFIQSVQDVPLYEERKTQASVGIGNLTVLESTCDTELWEVVEKLEQARQKTLKIVDLTYMEMKAQLVQRHQTLREKLGKMRENFERLKLVKTAELSPAEIVVLQGFSSLPKLLQAGVEDPSLHLIELVFKHTHSSKDSLEEILLPLNTASSPSQSSNESAPNSDRRIMRKIVKLFPSSWDEGEVWQVISQYGDEISTATDYIKAVRSRDKALRLLNLRFPNERQTVQRLQLLLSEKYKTCPNTEEVLRRVFESLQLQDPSSEETMKAANMFAKILIEGGKHEEAESLLKSAVQIGIERYQNEKNTRISACYLGWVCFNTGKYDWAEYYIICSLKGEENFGDIAFALGLLGDVLRAVNRYEDAETRYQEAFQNYKDHSRNLNCFSEVADLLCRWADFLSSMKRYEEAEEKYNYAIANHKANSPTSIGLADTLCKLGYLYINSMKRFAEGEEKYYEAVAIHKANNPTSIGLADTLCKLGDLYINSLKRFAEGEEKYNDAIAIHKANNPSSIGLADTLCKLGDLYINSLKRFAEGEEKYNDAIAIHKANNPSSIGLADTLCKLADDYRYPMKRYQDAEAKYNDAIAIHKANNPTSIGLADTLWQLGDLYIYSMKRFAEGEQKYSEAIAIHSANSPTSIGLADAMHKLGALYKDKLNRPKDAKKMDEQARAIYSSNMKTPYW